ncbi:MAG: aminotransferase class V-fold PLP-dependent enzyme [Oscillospiraceae bacterium]|nr:aminotransferase class V-fold PLP-dependent enzyme [Oscillospiraceae bacterium]
MIYLDNAATTLRKPPEVGEAMHRAVTQYSSPGRGGYAAALAAGELAFRCREQACELFGVSDPARVVFTASATHGLNIAIRSLVKPGSRVVISGYEHNAVTRTLESIPGVEATVLAGALFRPEEMVSLLEQTLDSSYDAVILCYVSNVFGYILPVEAMAAVCRARGVPLIVDAAQAAGACPVALEELGAAFVAMPGHKGLYGPQGIGLLLCGEAPTVPLLTGGTGSESLLQQMPDFLPDRLEAGTHNMPGIAGLSAGLDYLRRVGIDHILWWEEQRKAQLVNGLMSIPGVTVYASETAQAGVVSFRVPGLDSEVLGNRLARRDVAVRAGLHCAPLAHETVGTLETGTVRASLSAFTTEEEIRRFLGILRTEIARPSGGKFPGAAVFS